MTVSDLFRIALHDEQGDLLIEFPVGRKNNKNNNWYRDLQREALEHDSKLSTHVRNILQSIFGIPESVTGMLSMLYDDFQCSKHPRVHCVDVRSDPNVHVFSSLVHFRDSSSRSKEDSIAYMEDRIIGGADERVVRKWLNAYLISDSNVFLKKMSDVMNEWYPPACKYLDKTKKKRKFTSIGHAFLTVQDDAWVGSVIRRFASESIDEVVRAHYVLSRELQMRKKSSPSLFERKGELLYKFVQRAEIALMDIYAACKVADILIVARDGKHVNKKHQKPIMIYVGDLHARHLTSFIETLTGRSPDLEIPINSDGQRCLPVQ